MAGFQEANISLVSYTPGQWTNSQSFQRTSTERYEKGVDGGDVVQGRIFWLAAKEDLPERAVRRAHGKGAIEEGIYNHPVVVVSRPADESHLAHFHLITSLQGKKLDQLYNKSNEFHASRRSWYLPISPTPSHPDANSKKTKKRFPTLDLADGATLRWDSYVNIRHVYKIDWSLLKPYSNPDTPHAQRYRFDRESTIRLLAKSKILTMYEPGPQHESEMILKRSVSEPLRVSTHLMDIVQDRARGDRSPSVDSASVTSTVYSSRSSPPRSDFWRPGVEGYQIASPLPKVPPDPKAKPALIAFIPEIVRRPVDRLVENMQQIGMHPEGQGSTIFLDPKTVSRAANHIWRDVKGVTAVFIASI